MSFGRHGYANGKVRADKKEKHEQSSIFKRRRLHGASDSDSAESSSHGGIRMFCGHKLMISRDNHEFVVHYCDKEWCCDLPLIFGIFKLCQNFSVINI